MARGVTLFRCVARYLWAVASVSSCEHAAACTGRSDVAAAATSPARRPGIWCGCGPPAGAAAIRPANRTSHSAAVCGTRWNPRSVSVLCSPASQSHRPASCLISSWTAGSPPSPTDPARPHRTSRAIAVPGAQFRPTGFTVRSRSNGPFMAHVDGHTNVSRPARSRGAPQTANLEES